MILDNIMVNKYAEYKIKLQKNADLFMHLYIYIYI